MNRTGSVLPLATDKSAILGGSSSFYMDHDGARTITLWCRMWDLNPHATITSPQFLRLWCLPIPTIRQIKRKARELTSLAITNQLPLYFAYPPWQSEHTLHKWDTTASSLQDESSILVQLPLWEWRLYCEIYYMGGQRSKISLRFWASGKDLLNIYQ